MTALIIIGVILAIIVLIMLIPIGADIAFENSELRISGKLCGKLIQLYPEPPEEKKAEKKKKKEKEDKAQEEKPQEEKKALALPKLNKEEILELAKTGIGAAGKFGKKLKVDRFLLHYVAAGKDPYNTAMSFAYVNAALSSLAPMCARRFTVKDCSVWTDIDFLDDKMHLDFGLAMTIRIGQILGIGIATGLKALSILKKNKKRLKEEAANAAPEQAAENVPEAPEAAGESKEDINKENIQADERKNSNG